jgi:murein L,D-transpeptidase YcbB/YkuD
MNRYIYNGSCWLLLLIYPLFLVGCHEKAEKPKEKDIVEIPEAFDVRVSRNLQSAVKFTLDNKGRLNDTIVLVKDSLVAKLYEKKGFEPVWCAQEKWLSAGDSLFSFIERSREYGLFPSDYHYRALSGIRQKIAADTLAQRDAAIWSRAELMLSDAFFLICHDLKKGHIPFDSVTLRTDSILHDDFYMALYDQYKQTDSLTAVFHQLEPKHRGYDSLKVGLKFFLDSIQVFKRYTYINYPDKDSARLFNSLQRRLFEEDIVLSATQVMDTAAWRQAISQYQANVKLKVTGKVNENTVARLNNTNWEKFKRVAITMDRYRLLPDSMPPTYIWVNLPAFYMKVVDADTVAVESRVIVGQPKTRTPLLTSAVSNFITYPQWTVPYSIIFKEMLPQIRKSTAYLAKQNLMVVDKNDSIIHPDSIKWWKLNKNYFPYLLKQRQGDDNSLGVLKFNFPNKYSVYLHDTNARWLFSNSNRALSHGCVRVKDFMKLADFLVRNDSVRYHPDTLRNWIKRQEKHVVSNFKRVPIFIRYFSCEGKDGKLKFYDDIYAEDKLLRERYFADKAIL